MNAGIDYGCGRTNIDTKNGIRYGSIYLNDISIEAWEMKSEEIPNMACPHCGDDLTEKMYNTAMTYCSKEGDPDDLKERTCPSCDEVLCDLDFQDTESLGSCITNDGYLAQMDSNDSSIMIIKSPYYTLCNYCSPCAPGAGYIKDQNEDGIKAYCLGPEFFEDDDENKPTFYRVEDDSIVE